MFDFAFSEIALVGVVALLVIGPKDMPVAIKAITDVIKKARRMAGEFQGHVDEMVREANLHEVRDSINDLRSMNIKSRIMSAVDGDGTIHRALNENPFTTSAPIPTPTQPGTVEAAGAEPVIAAPPAEMPAFVPPGEAASIAPPGFVAPVPPAFIPPDAAAPRT